MSSAWTRNKFRARIIAEQKENGEPIRIPGRFNWAFNKVMIGQVMECLLDQKYILIRYLLIRTEFNKYFCDGFEQL